MKHVLSLLGLISALVVFVRGTISSHPFANDEPDYMYAVSLGLGANYTDSPSQPITEYVKTGLKRGRDATQRAALSEEVRASGDVTFYRHYHGPLYFYWLSAVAHWAPNEYVSRSLSLLFPLLTVLVIYFGCLWLVPGERGWLAAVLSSALFLWSYPTLRTVMIAPHPLFVLCVICALILLAKVLQTGKRGPWYGAVVATGFAFCTLEVALVLIVSMVVCLFLARRQLRIDWRFVARSIALFVGAVLLVWPGAILKLSFLKAYLFMAYLSLFRNAPWGEVGFVQTWMVRFGKSPVEWGLLGATILLFCCWRRFPERRVALPFLLYGGLMLLTLLRVNTDTPRYMLPFLPAFHVFVGLVVGTLLWKLKPWARYGLLALLCVCLFSNTERQMSACRITSDSNRPSAVLAYFKQHDLGGKRLLVPQGDVPTIHYYFPNISLRGYTDPAAIPAELAAGKFDGVLYPDEPIRYEAVKPRSVSSSTGVAPQALRASSDVRPRN